MAQLNTKSFTEVDINFTDVEDVKSFIRTNCTYDDQIDVCSDGFVVDGKSILGVLSLDLSKKVTVRVYGEKASSFAKNIKDLFLHHKEV